MARQRVHNEWFRTVSLNKRKSCPNCDSEVHPPERIWSWGEYSHCRWYTIQYLCKACWPIVQAKLQQHAHGCGCMFQLCSNTDKLPGWMVLCDGEEKVS